jgi:hypothetical protein
MSQSGYTPILNYSSATASAVPLAANLAQGELAINNNDGKLFYKDSSGVVQTMASKATGAIGGSTTQVQFNNSGVLGGSANLTFNGTTLTAAGLAGPLNGTVGATTPAAGTFTSLSDSGNLTFTGTGNRILGDFSNATFANRVLFQSSTTNGNTLIGAIPNGTGTNTRIQAFSTSDPANASTVSIEANATVSQSIINADRTGTGTYLPMTFFTSGTEKLRIAADTTGTYTFGGTAPRITGDFSNATIASRLFFQTSTTNSSTSFGVIPNGTSTTSASFLYNNSDPTNASSLGLFALAAETRITSGITGTGTYLPITFYTNSSERMRIDTSGNVGIGTSSPGNKLQVSGDGARIAAQCATNSASAEAELEAQVYNYWGGTGGPTYTGTAIQQYGAAATGTSAGISNANLGVLRFQNGAGGLIYTNGSNPLIFATWDTERMRIDSSGNVGIGTSSPGARLDVRTTSSTQATFTRTGQSAVCSIYQSTADTYLSATNSGASLILATQDTERMRIDSSGNVGIGTNSPSGRLHVTAASGSQTDAYFGNQTAGAKTTIRVQSASNSDGYIFFERSGASENGYIRYSQASDFMAFQTASAERMRITSAGRVCINTTYSDTQLNIAYNGSSIRGVDINNTVSSNQDAIYFRTNGSNVGRINTDASNTSYVTSSDYRLKENIAPMVGALDKVAALKPCTYTWKVDGSDGQGFIAHELAEVVPDCVSGEKDAVNEDGSIKPQGIDTSFLVATLTAALQEAHGLIKDLQARVDALESK